MPDITRRSFMISGAALTAAYGLTPLHAFANTSATDIRSPMPAKPLESQVNVALSIFPSRDANYWELQWEFAEDAFFEHVLNTDNIYIAGNEQRDITINLINIPPGKAVFYRLSCKHCSAQAHSQPSNTTNALNYTVLPNTLFSQEEFVAAKRATIVQRVY